MASLPETLTRGAVCCRDAFHAARRLDRRRNVRQSGCRPCHLAPGGGDRVRCLCTGYNSFHAGYIYRFPLRRMDLANEDARHQLVIARVVEYPVLL